MEEQDLRFEALKHEYAYKGKRVPSVTEVLKGSGIVDYHFSDNRAMERGTAVHKATEFLDTETLDRSSVMAELEPYLEAYEKFKIESKFVPLLIEHRVFHPIGFAGTFDRMGAFGGEHAVIDIKTGAIPAWAGLQLSAYANAEWGVDKPKNLRRFALELRDNGNYKLKEFSNPMDWLIFQSSFQVYTWKLLNT